MLSNQGFSKKTTEAMGTRQLANEILEISQLMGLVLATDKQKAWQIIQDKLDMEAMSSVERGQGKGNL